MSRIYLDHNATTLIDTAVLEAVIQELKRDVGNPSSAHFDGRQARQRLSQARQSIASFLKVNPNELIFTSGGTEAANLLLRGFFFHKPGGHLITSSTEHSCIYRTAQDLEKRGCEVSYLSTGRWGAVQPEDLRKAIQPTTRLISLMAVNNETGVKTDINSIAKIAQEFNIPFVVDGVAWLGKEEVVIPPGVTAVFFSGHKFHAPTGIGMLFCRHSLKFDPLLWGGHQEFDRRAGTENLPGIIGLAAAVKILATGQQKFSEHMKKMRDRLEIGIKSNLDNVVVNGDGPRVVNTSNLSFIGVDGESLLIKLDQENISVSHGSACGSGAIEPSRILLKMGIPLVEARTAIRFSVSRYTTEEEIDRCIDVVTRAVKQLKRL